MIILHLRESSSPRSFLLTLATCGKSQMTITRSEAIRSVVFVLATAAALVYSGALALSFWRAPGSWEPWWQWPAGAASSTLATLLCAGLLAWFASDLRLRQRAWSVAVLLLWSFLPGAYLLLALITQLASLTPGLLVWAALGLPVAAIVWQDWQRGDEGRRPWVAMLLCSALAGALSLWAAYVTCLFAAGALAATMQ